MPSSQTILSLSAALANEWQTMAVAWHALLGAMLLGLLAGWRPSNRVAGLLLAAPLASVSALAWISGNPFNGAVFGGLALALAIIAFRLGPEPVRVSSLRWRLTAAMLIAFGWTYPHFLHTDRWTVYLYAAPFGLLPCPTLSALAGMALMLGMLGSRPWSVTLAAAGVVYGVIGVASLGVTLDYGLIAGAIGLGVAAAFVHSRSVRAGRDEHARSLPGDDLIPAPMATLTHAVTIACPREDVWPWIAQMGAGSRAGWYSYDTLDNGRRPSATRIRPELQGLSIGMIFPALPGVAESFQLLAFDPARSLVLGWVPPGGTPSATWAFVLEDAPDGSTRLITRARGSDGYRFHGLPRWLTKLAVRAVHFVMQRKQLLGIAARAERAFARMDVTGKRRVAA